MLRKLLEISRYLMVLPIVGSLILTLSVVISGLGMVLVKSGNSFERESIPRERQSN